MVILYGYMSRCDRIPHQVALEDIWMALDVLPSIRWRWERKDLSGGYPLITRLAEEILTINLHRVGPPSHPVLLSEPDWEQDTAKMASTSTPELKHSPRSVGSAPGSGSGDASLEYSNGFDGQGTPNVGHAQQFPSHPADVPTELPHPFFPEQATYNENGQTLGETPETPGDSLLAASGKIASWNVTRIAFIPHPGSPLPPYLLSGVVPL